MELAERGQYDANEVEKLYRRERRAELGRAFADFVASTGTYVSTLASCLLVWFADLDNTEPDIYSLLNQDDVCCKCH